MLIIPGGSGIQCAPRVWFQDAESRPALPSSAPGKGIEKNASRTAPPRSRYLVSSSYPNGGTSMSEERKVGSVTYRDVDKEYFEQRGLRRHAGVWMLWALGVAAVISGDFSGWNFGLDVGGFGGLLLATAVLTILYFGLCFSIAEMAPALPATGA